MKSLCFPFSRSLTYFVSQTFRGSRACTRIMSDRSPSRSRSRSPRLASPNPVRTLNLRNFFQSIFGGSIEFQTLLLTPCMARLDNEENVLGNDVVQNAKNVLLVPSGNVRVRHLIGRSQRALRTLTSPLCTRRLRRFT